MLNRWRCLGTPPCAPRSRAPGKGRRTWRRGRGQGSLRDKALGKEPRGRGAERCRWAPQSPRTSNPSLPSLRGPGSSEAQGRGAAGGARGGAPGPGLLPHSAAGPRVVLGVVSEGAAAPRPLPLRVRGERLDGRPLGLGLPAAGGQGGQRAAGGREHGLFDAGRPVGRGGPGRAQGGQPRLGLRLRGPPRRPGRQATTVERGRPRRPRVPPGPPAFGGRQAARLAEWARPPEPGPLSPSAPPRRRPGPLGHRGAGAARGLRTGRGHGRWAFPGLLPPWRWP